MRRLFLHIGAHKTGTTALQQGLLGSKTVLALHGAAYVGAPSLHPFIGQVSPTRLLPRGYALLDPDGLAEQVSAADQDMVIGSSENFSFFFETPQIQDLEKALRPLFSQITVISYLRRQDRHAISHHQEGARPDRPAEADLWGNAPNALPPAQDQYLDYDHRIGLWADVFGPENLMLRVYDRGELKEGDITADFLALIGLNISDVTAFSDRNPSLGAAQTKLGHLMNQTALPQRAAQAILDRLAATGRLLPSRAEAAAFLDRYRASNRRLNARFGISTLPDLFNDDFSDYPEAAQNDWTEAGANDALRAVMAELSTLAPTLAALSADDFRIAAQALSQTQPDIAQRLIHAAAALRPQGPAIVRLKAELDRRNRG